MVLNLFKLYRCSQVECFPLHTFVENGPALSVRKGIPPLTYFCSQCIHIAQMSFLSVVYSILKVMSQWKWSRWISLVSIVIAWHWGIQMSFAASAQDKVFSWSCYICGGVEHYAKITSDVMMERRRWWKFQNIFGLRTLSLRSCAVM